MKFNPRGLIVTAAGILLLWAALKVQSVGAFVDNALLIALGALLLFSSLAVVVASIRGRPVFGQVGAFREIRSWFSNGSNIP